MQPLISVIIPTLNEEQALPRCLAAACSQQTPFEILVADGGSSDHTVEVASAAGARVVQAARGRALQMNAAAQEAAGQIYLFLHADTRLPVGALAAVREAVTGGASTGAFQLRFDNLALRFRLAAAAANAYCGLTGDLFGDRGIFCTREAFETVGGYPEIPILEDLEISLRWKRLGLRPRLLRPSVITSVRRLARQGVLRGFWTALRILAAHHCGLPVEETLRRYYSEVLR